MNKYLLFNVFLSVFLLSCKDQAPSYNDVIQSAKKENVKVEEEILSNSTGKVLPENSREEEIVSTNTIESDELTKAETNSEEGVKETTEEPKPVSPPKKKVVKKGVMTFDDMVYEFGEIEQGEQVSHNFYFTNTGNAPINVKSCTATCGCTIPSYPFIPINPGEKGYIGITFNSTGKYGAQTPTVTVITDAKLSTIKLKMTGKVNVELEAEKTQPDTVGSSD